MVKAIENLKNNTYKYNAINSSEHKEAKEIIIGDEKQNKFFPRVKSKFRDNAANFSFGTDDVNGELLFEGKDKFMYKTKDNKIIRMYKKNSKDFVKLTDLNKNTISEDLFEYDMILNKRPKNDEVIFTIETKGLEFSYQPDITLEERKKGVYKPVFIRKSYAVFLERDIEFQHKKVMHIYSPKITDSNGKEIWGDIEINKSSKKMIIKIPSNFLDDCKYPIIVDPTLGYTSNAGTFQPLSANGISPGYVHRINGNIIDGSQGGVVNHIYGYVDYNIILNGGSTYVRGAMCYMPSGVGNVAWNGLGSTNKMFDLVGTGSIATTWFSGALMNNGSSYIMSGLKCCLNIMLVGYGDGKNVGRMNSYYDDTAGSIITTSAFSDPGGTVQSSNITAGKQYSVYLDYTAASGAPPPAGGWSGGDVNLVVNGSIDKFNNVNVGSIDTLNGI